MKLHFLILGVCLLAYGTVGTSDLKSSLTFVIDETDSMNVDIQEVIKVIDEIVDTVTNSSSSPIEEFVLVTFNDEVKVVTKTEDKASLKGNISDINVGGGDSCPDKSLTGIELALNESRDGSLLYVFTDASAEDYNLTEKVEGLSQKKGVQIVFLLTGVCQGNRRSPDYLVYHDLAKATNGQVFHLQKQEIGEIVFLLTGVCQGNRRSPDYLVYHDLAKATNGQVFHLQKQEIGEILKYVENTIDSRKTIIASKTLPAGGNKFDVNVDGDTKELIIAVSGESPSVTVTSGGAAVNATIITKLQEIAIVKVGVKPGVYGVDVRSRTESRVVVSANTSVHFQHGFSTVAPSAITDTVKRPVPRTDEEPEVKSYLSIQLGPGGANVKLDSALILDMDDNVLLDQQLKVVNKNEHFYTTEPFITPDDMFKIAVKGYDTKKEINVTRYGLTPVKPQSNKERAIEKKPEVTIEGAPTINADYYKPLKLRCKVSSWPKSDVIWKSDDSSEKLLYNKVSKVELPYEYISVLEIPKVTKNTTYTCEATNREGDGANNVTVQTVETEFIEVDVEDTTIEYQKPGQITCNVNAYPPANISWYKGRSALKPSENLNISADGSVILIQSMEPKFAGPYYCLAKNAVDKKVKPLKVSIGGVGSPKIDKTIYQLNAAEGESVGIQCRVTATPKATLEWSFKNATTSIALNDTSDTISLYDLETSNAGTYSCKAENDFGVDYHGTELVIEYAPTISKNSSYERQRAVEGHMVILNCSANGVPAPNIIWTHNGIPINTTRHSFYTNGSLGFSAVPSDGGQYECEARNDLGSDATTIDLEVIIPVAVESPEQTYIEQEEGTPLTLQCRADGSPQPNITWLYQKTPKADVIKLSHNYASGDLRFKRIHHGQSGEYTCLAANEGGSKNVTYIVSVTARPSILYTMKSFHGVIDDMYLRVPCDTTGNPKPAILWTNATGYDVASDTEWYLVGEDGSLIIKNISIWAEGYYTCTASNKYGSVSEVFSVIVDPYPIERFLSIQVEEGKSANVPCSVPHKLTDRLRWFKDGKTINTTELLLRNVTTEDAGTYTCRVSSVDRPAQTGSTKVEVGFKPRFITDDGTNIPYRYGGVAVMDCSADGIPAPKVSWLHDGIAIEVADFRYQFMMSEESQRGSYTCIVKNQYGYAQQDFFISDPHHLKACGVTVDWTYHDKVAETGCCYSIISKKARNWRMAREWCRSEGAEMLVYEDEHEFDVVRDLLQEFAWSDKFTPSMYTGMFADQYRTWWTVDGELLTDYNYAPWTPGEPNNGQGDQYCGALYTDTGLYDDINCYTEINTICKIRVQSDLLKYS